MSIEAAQQGNSQIQHKCPCYCHRSSPIPNPCQYCSCWFVVTYPNKITSTMNNDIELSQQKDVIKLLQKRIEKLEKYDKCDNKHFEMLTKRIEKLEFDVKNNSNTIGCVDSAYDKCIEEHDKRLKYLEHELARRGHNTSSVLNAQNNWSQETEKRIEKLESYREQLLDQVRLFNDAIEGLAKEVASLNEGYGSLYVRVESLESQLSLKEAIENTVLPKTFDMTFGEAIETMKRGCKVGCWHRDDIYVYLIPTDGTMGSHFVVKTITGEFYPWHPNQREILGENWRIIE